MRRLLGLLFITGCTSSVEPAVCPAGTTEVQGICATNCSADADCLFDQTCGASGVCAAVPDDAAPEIRLFSARNPVVTRDDPVVVLDYAVNGAARVEISPPGQVLDAPVGSFQTTIATPTTFTLTASGPNGPDAVRTERVLLGNPDAPTVAFNVDPSSEAPCEEVLISWTVVNAQGAVKVDLLVDGGAARTLPGPSGSSVPIELDGPASLQLVASSDDGDEVRSEIVNWQPTFICSVEPLPGDSVIISDTVFITIETLGLDRVEIRDPMVNQPIWFVDITSAERTEVYALVTVTRGNMSLQVEGLVADQVVAVRELALFGEGAGVPPAIRDFRATPMYVENDGAPINLTWQNFLGANVTLDGVPQMSPVSVPITGSTNFWLEATRGTLTSRARQRAWLVLPEVEANDIPETANEMIGMSSSGFVEVGRAGSIEQGDLADWYSVQVPGETLRVAVVDPTGRNCNQLVGAELDIRSGMSSLSGFPRPFMGCPVITLPQVEAGILYVGILSDNALGLSMVDYVLLTDTTEYECGDGIVEVNETCDDGNDYPGDGCDLCALEAGFAYVVSDLAGALTPPPRDAEPLEMIGIPGIGTGMARDDGLALIPMPTEITMFGHRHAGILVSANGFLSLAPLGVPGQGMVVVPTVVGIGVGPGADVILRQTGEVRWWRDEGAYVVDFRDLAFKADLARAFSMRIRLGEGGDVEVSYAGDTSAGLLQPLLVNTTGQYQVDAGACRPTSGNGCIFTPQFSQ